MSKLAGLRYFTALMLYAGVILSVIGAPLGSTLESQFALFGERSYLAPKLSLYQLATFKLAHPDLSVYHQALLYENTSRARWNAKDFPGALHEAELLTALGRQHGDKTIECLGLLQQAYAYWMMGKIQKAYALIPTAEQFPPSTLSISAQVKVLITKAQAQAEQRSMQAAQRTIAAAVRVAATSGDDAVLFLAARFQANLAVRVHDHALALASVDRLLVLGRRSPYGERLVRARQVEYAVATAAGLTTRASHAMKESIVLMRSLHLDEALGNALVGYADFQLKRDLPAEAAALSAEALKMETVLSNAELVGRAHLNHAIALIRLGKLAEGKKEVEWLFASSLPRAQLLAYLPHYIQALTRAGDAAGSVQASALHKQIETEEALELAKEDEKTQGHIEWLARESRLRTLEAASDRAQRNMWVASTVTAAIGILGILLLYARLRSNNRLLEATNRQLYISSNCDFLTGLFNRRYIENAVAGLALHEDSNRDDSVIGHGLVLLIDIDHFKQINDTHGHAVGDHVLKIAAERLSTLLGKEGLVARWGGEEFLALLPAANGSETASIAVRTLQAVSASPIVVDEATIAVTISIGICRLRLALVDRPATWDELLHIADEALYLAKQNGRNRACAVIDTSDATSTQLARGLRINCDEGKVILIEAHSAGDQLSRAAAPL